MLTGELTISINIEVAQRLWLTNIRRIARNIVFKQYDRTVYWYANILNHPSSLCYIASCCISMSRILLTVYDKFMLSSNFSKYMLKKFEVEACDINLDTNDNKLYTITYF